MGEVCPRTALHRLHSCRPVPRSAGSSDMQAPPMAAVPAPRFTLTLAEVSFANLTTAVPAHPLVLDRVALPAASPLRESLRATSTESSEREVNWSWRGQTSLEPWAPLTGWLPMMRGSRALGLRTSSNMRSPSPIRRFLRPAATCLVERDRGSDLTRHTGVPHVSDVISVWVRAPSELFLRGFHPCEPNDYLMTT